MNYKTASPNRYELLKPYARENRRNATLAEMVLWEQLRGNALGVKFLRQHVIGDYIVDFVSKQDGLIVEVDGGYHAELKQQEADVMREEKLERMGFQILRFTNEEVLFDTEHVLEQIEESLNR
ncbi:MAG: endonuclease domain-containing protein [Bacteroidaceae bacterium]|nr:endonuclease domain-containing protein [Bacteroidaceae bacterium]